MDLLRVRGGRRLEGEVEVSGAKNAVLPILAACLLVEDEVRLRRVARIEDVESMLEILRHLGCDARWTGAHELWVCSRDATEHELPERMTREMRSSIMLLGSVLARFRRARVAYPGGCEIGLRPIDLHLSGLARLGARIVEDQGYIECRGERLCGATVHLDYPSVGATENLMLAAVCARGTTLIHNAAKEPEIVDLQGFLNDCGAWVRGAGSDVIRVEGLEGARLHGCDYEIMPDRIEAGTWLVAGAITGGDIWLRRANPAHLQPLLAKLREMGCAVEARGPLLHLWGPPRPRQLRRLQTHPYPGFPTDMQAQYMALMSVMEGSGAVEENIFENRYKHVGELRRMGADIEIHDRLAIVSGVESLHGARVRATDLRGGASLVLAGLRAEGETEVEDIFHIQRGYEDIAGHLRQLGAELSIIREGGSA